MKAPRLICALVAAVLLAGCSTPYMTNRKRDALDIFTFSGGEGVGAKARVGPISAGLLLQGDQVGLRGGAVLHPTKGEAQMGRMDVTCTLVGIETFGEDSLTMERGKWVASTTWAGINCFPLDYSNKPKRPIRAAIPQFTQIEAVAALGLSLRVGFNPGELVDFILGWTSVDIFSDDVASEKDQEGSAKRPEEMAPKN